MPELPEVETVRTGLERLLPGKVISSVTFDWAKSFPNAESDMKHFLIGATITHVARRAKVLIIELSSSYSVLIHLKMTGQLIFDGSEHFGAGHPTASLKGPLPDRSTRVTITFSDRSKLFFNDQRKFGWMKMLPSVEVANIDLMKNLGPEPLADDFSVADFKQQLSRRLNSAIKAVLLDQSIIAGIGNIYADESLWGVRIHPATPVKLLSDRKIAALYKNIRDVLTLAIAKGGSTDRNYVDAEGNKGSYLAFAQVFRKEGLACPRCGHTIIKIRVAGRGTHICPHCQKQVRS